MLLGGHVYNPQRDYLSGLFQALTRACVRGLRAQQVSSGSPAFIMMLLRWGTLFLGLATGYKVDDKLIVLFPH